MNLGSGGSTLESTAKQKAAMLPIFSAQYICYARVLTLTCGPKKTGGFGPPAAWNVPGGRNLRMILNAQPRETARRDKNVLSALPPWPYRCLVGVCDHYLCDYAIPMDDIDLNRDLRGSAAGRLFRRSPVPRLEVWPAGRRLRNPGQERNLAKPAQGRPDGRGEPVARRAPFGSPLISDSSAVMKSPFALANNLHPGLDQ